MAGRKTKYAVSLLVNKIWNGIFRLTNYIDYKTMMVVENETQKMFIVRYDDFLIKCRDPRYKGKRRSLKEIEEAVEKAQPDFKCSSSWLSVIFFRLLSSYSSLYRIRLRRYPHRQIPLKRE